MQSEERKITLLDLLSELQAQGHHGEKTLVSLVVQLIRSGRVVLCGTYAGNDGSVE
jgi:hypothetical protein